MLFKHSFLIGIWLILWTFNSIRVLPLYCLILYAYAYFDWMHFNLTFLLCKWCPKRNNALMLLDQSRYLWMGTVASSGDRVAALVMWIFCFKVFSSFFFSFFFFKFCKTNPLVVPTWETLLAVLLLILYADVGNSDPATYEEKWFTYHVEQKATVESYISSLRSGKCFNSHKSAFHLNHISSFLRPAKMFWFMLQTCFLFFLSWNLLE